MFGGGPAVAGEDNTTQAGRAQFIDDGGRLGTDIIAQDDPAEQIADLEPDLGEAGIHRGADFEFRGPGIGGEPVTTAETAFHALEAGLDALAGDGFEVVEFDGGKALLFAMAGDGAGERMGGKLFQGIGEAGDFGFAARREAFDFFTRSSPVVRVPVLSRHTTLTPASFSTAAPPRNKIPWRAPKAMAARTADGMDNTSAQGEETTRRVMAR